jgi:hypothetical protein
VGKLVFYEEISFLKAYFHSVEKVARSTFCDHFLFKCVQSTSSVAPHCLYFKRKWSQKVDRATFSTEWKSAFIKKPLQKERTRPLIWRRLFNTRTYDNAKLEKKSSQVSTLCVRTHFYANVIIDTVNYDIIKWAAMPYQL